MSGWENQDKNGTRASNRIEVADTVNTVSLRALPLNKIEVTTSDSWIVHGWLRYGDIGILAGERRQGKTQLALQLAAAVGQLGANGWLAPDGPGDTLLPICTTGTAVYATWEDRVNILASRVYPELTEKAQSAYIVPMYEPVITATGGPTTEAKHLREFCKEEAADLLVIDSLNSACPRVGDYEINLHETFFADWSEWAKANDTSIIVIAHGKNNALEKNLSVQFVWTLSGFSNDLIELRGRLMLEQSPASVHITRTPATRGRWKEVILPIERDPEHG